MTTEDLKAIYDYFIANGTKESDYPTGAIDTEH